MSAHSVMPSASSLAAPTALERRELAPLWYVKVARTFVFAFLAGFLSALLPIIEGVAKGSNVDFTLLEALLVGLIVGAIAAAIRAVVAMLPLFKDDNDIGMAKR